VSKRRKTKYGPAVKISGRWVAHQDAMTRILRGLSPSARRILDTLEIEHCRHGRLENGRLVCTYTDFARHVRRSCISRALRELVSAGIIEIVRTGRRSWADLRTPSLYRLTFEPTYQDGKAVAPTHDWKKQKARPDLTTGARPESTTGNGQKPGRNRPPREAKSQAGIDHSLSRSRVVGGGGVADFSSLPASPSAHPQDGAGPSAPPPPLPHDKLPSVTAPSCGRLQ
jgi:hypothetical protein